MKTQHLKQKFGYCKNIGWGDAVEMINMGYKNKTLSFLMSHNLDKIPRHYGGFNYGFGDGKLSENKPLSPPTFGLHGSDKLSPKLKRIAAKVHRQWNTNVDGMQLFISLGADATTFGKHKDDCNVLLVQAVGKMKYYVEGIGPLDFIPGDGIFISKGVSHSPYVIEPRITLSFNW